VRRPGAAVLPQHLLQPVGHDLPAERHDGRRDVRRLRRPGPALLPERLVHRWPALPEPALRLDRAEETPNATDARDVSRKLSPGVPGAIGDFPLFGARGRSAVLIRA